MCIVVPELSKNRNLNLNLTPVFSALNTALSAEVVRSFRDVNNSRKKHLHPQQLERASGLICICVFNLKKKKKITRESRGEVGTQ